MIKIMPNSQKGFAHILGLLLLIIGLGISVYLVQQKTNLFSRAASAPIPVPMPVLTLSPKFEVGLEVGDQSDTGKVPLVVESGARWVRLNFIGSDWSAGSSDVATYNTIINAYVQQKIKIIGLIGAQSVKGPPGESAYDRSNPGNFTDKFVDTADMIVDRFGDRVKVFEIFNEPNDWAVTDCGDTPEEQELCHNPRVPSAYFAAYLKSVYQKIKIEKGRRDISLISGPLVSLDHNSGADYLSQAYREGLKSDGVGYHIYVAQGANEQASVEPNLIENLDAIKAVINQRDPGKKIWISEFGWGTRGGDVSETIQAENLTRAYALFKTRSEVRMAMWFTIQDFGAPEEFGLRHGDGEPKDAWEAFQRINGITLTPTTASTPTPTCPDDVHYWDSNVSSCIHKHGGVFRNSACVYVFDREGCEGCNHCVTPILTPTAVSCSVCGADVDKNGSVAIMDMMRVGQCIRIGYSGSAPGQFSCQKADVNGDGKINASDLNCVREQFGRQCSGSR